MPVSGALRHRQVETTVVGYATVQDIRLKIPISFEDTSGVVATVPGDSIITGIVIMRDPEWDIIALFAAGKATDLDWLVKNHQHDLSESGAGAVEVAGEPVYVAAETDIIFTWDQGGAVQGAGYVVITYTVLSS